MKNLCLLFSLLFPFTILSQINPDNITIIRDNWGVPHIYAKTDAEVAYGLAWAAAEDDFKTIQETLLPLRGKLGSYKGVEGAILDFAVEVIDVHPLVEEKYDTDISPEFKKILDAYAAGMNAYAKKHPKEVLIKKLFPVNGKDVIKGYVLALTLLSSVQDDLGKIISGKIGLFDKSTPTGSNAFAVNSNKTKDGQTYLAINPHQPLEGPYSWYEAHLVSEEGLNVLGATLLGADTIRALVLEYFGYKTNVMEFISSEHTSKNLLITAVKDSSIELNSPNVLNQITELKSLFGITRHQLETLMLLDS